MGSEDPKEIKTEPKDNGDKPTQVEDAGATPPKAELPGTDLGSDDPVETNAENKAAENEEKGTPAYATNWGPPEGDYEPFELPDGGIADPELQAIFSPFAKRIGLSQKGAQEFIQLRHEMNELQLRQWGNHLAELKTQAQAHPEIGGARYAPAVAAGKAVIAKFGTPGLRQALNRYGVGAHPEMIAFLAKIGAAIGETPTLAGGGEGAATVAKPLHELMYKD